MANDDEILAATPEQVIRFIDTAKGMGEANINIILDILRLVKEGNDLIIRVKKEDANGLLPTKI